MWHSRPPQPFLTSTLSTELFISLWGCYGARHYGSHRPCKHLFAQLPGGFLKNCFPRSAAGNTSHSSTTTNWKSLFMPEQCCQNPRGWRGQPSTLWTRTQDPAVPGRAPGSTCPGDFPKTPSASSLLYHLGLSGSYGSGQHCFHPTAPAAPRLPRSTEEDVAGVCFSSQPLPLSLLFAPQLWLLLPCSHHLHWQLVWGSTLPSPMHPAPGARGVSSSPFSQSHSWASPGPPQAAPPSLTPPALLFPLSPLPPSPPHPLPPPTHSSSWRQQQK